MKLPEFKRFEFKLPDIPKKVAVSLAVVLSSGLSYVLLLLTLGEAADAATADVARLRNQVATTKTRIETAKDDISFIASNKGRFDALMASDKLIPHTRRTAIRQMQTLALEFGLTTLNYNFQAAGTQGAEAVSSQPKSGDYKLYVENIELTVGAALDRDIFAFLAALNDDFPGSVVILNLEMSRAPLVSAEALNAVSRGEDSKLVEGKLRVTWRTAQRQDEKK